MHFVLLLRLAALLPFQLDELVHSALQFEPAVAIPLLPRLAALALPVETASLPYMEPLCPLAMQLELELLVA
jgi:hypothetical protein